MRFMIIVKASADSEAGEMPQEEVLNAMQKYHEELQKAGVLRDAVGLQSSARGWRIHYDGDQRNLVEGPFGEASDLFAGYTIIQVRTREEAIEWTKRFPNPSVGNQRAEIEVRQMFEVQENNPDENLDILSQMGVVIK